MRRPLPAVLLVWASACAGAEATAPAHVADATRSAPTSAESPQPSASSPPATSPATSPAERSLTYLVVDEVDAHDVDGGGPTQTELRVRCEPSGGADGTARLRCAAIDDPDAVILPSAELDLRPFGERDDDRDGERDDEPSEISHEARDGLRCERRRRPRGSPYGPTVERRCFDAVGLRSLELENVGGPRRVRWRREP